MEHWCLHPTWTCLGLVAAGPAVFAWRRAWGSDLETRFRELPSD